MTAWSPAWHDVRFDHAAALAAADACRAAARRLDTIARDHARSADEARIDWEGVALSRFDVAVREWEEAAEDLIERLLQAAATIEASAGDAHDEQRRRERDRDQWREERDRERRLADQLRRAEHERARAV